MADKMDVQWVGDWAQLWVEMWVPEKDDSMAGLMADLLELKRDMPSAALMAYCSAGWTVYYWVFCSVVKKVRLLAD